MLHGVNLCACLAVHAVGGRACSILTCCAVLGPVTGLSVSALAKHLALQGEIATAMAKVV